MKNAEITSTDPLEVQMSKSGAQHPVAFSAVQADQLAIGDSVLVDVIDRRVFLVNKEDAVGSGGGEPDDGSVTYSKLDPSFHAALAEAENEVRLAQEAVYDEGVFADNVIRGRHIIANEIDASKITSYELTAQNATIAGDLLANSITAGSLDADVIGAGKIDADYIDVDSITIGSGQITGTLDADQIDVESLNIDAAQLYGTLTLNLSRSRSSRTMLLTNLANIDGTNLPGIRWEHSSYSTEATIGADWVGTSGRVDIIIRPQLGKVIIDGGIEKKQAGELASESWVDNNYIATSYRSTATPRDVLSDTFNSSGSSSFLSRADHRHATNNPLNVSGLRIGNNWRGTGIRVGRSDGATFRFYAGIIRALSSTSSTSDYARLDAIINDQGSHRHLKDSIQLSNQPILDGLRALPIYDFTMKAEDDGPTRTGFMIDELPEAVQTVPDPEDDAPPGYTVAHMFGWVIKAIQELADELDQLKGEKNEH